MALALVALLCGFLHAPFLHLHTDGVERTEGSFHLHAAADGIGARPETAVYLDWSPAPATPPAVAVVPELGGLDLAPAPRLAELPRRTSARAHGPPRGRPSSPRPPPVV